MIGQKRLTQLLDEQTEKNTLARFIILEGDRGSGKKMLAHYIAKKLSVNCIVEVGNKIDEIRYIISESYRVQEQTVYIIKEADDMSVAAKNALLKVTEEPPNKARFILLLRNLDNTLDTIKSRGAVYTLDRYSQQELEDYLKSKCPDNYKEYKTAVLSACYTPGEIDLLLQNDPKKFHSDIAKVIHNISTVSGANAFKIADMVNLGNDSEKYDLIMFWRTFQNMCYIDAYFSKDENVIYEYLEWMQITSTYLSQLRVKGVNKKSLFDMWLLDIRKVKIEEESE